MFIRNFICAAICALLCLFPLAHGYTTDYSEFEWKLKASLPAARHYHAQSTLLDGRMVVTVG